MASRHHSGLLPFALCSLIGVVIAFQVMLLAISRERALDLIGVRAANRAQANAHEVEALLKKIDLLLLDMREHVDPTEVARGAANVSPERVTAMHKLLSEHAARFPAMADLNLVGPDGSYVFSSGPSRPSANLSDRAYYQQLRTSANDTFTVSEIVKSKSLGIWTVVACRRLSLPDGTFAGLIVSALDPDDVSGLMHAVDLQSWTLAVVDDNLRYLTRQPVTPAEVAPPLLEPAFAAWLQRDQPGIVRQAGLGEAAPRIWGTQAIAGTTLHVVAGFDEAAALAQWRRDVLIHALVAGLLVAGGIALVLMQRRREQADAEAAILDQRLRRSQQEVQELVHLVPVGVFRLHGDGNGGLHLTYASPRCPEILGTDPATFLAAKASAPIHPDDLAGFTAALQTAAKQGDFQWVGRMIQGGRQRWLHLTATRAHDTDGNEQWAGIVQDVTSRREAEEALFQQWNLTRVVFDNAPIGILLTAPDLQSIIFTNRAASTMLGRPSEELTGLDPLAIIHPEDADRVWQTLLQAMRPGSPPERLTHRAITPDGKVVELEVLATGVPDERGHLLNGLILLRDITEAKRLEQQLRQSEKMQAIGMLAGGIAHDFNNILACIIGFADLARRRRRPEDVGLANYLDQIAGAADRAKALVQQILSFSRRDAGERQPVHLQSNVREVMNLLRASIPSSVDIAVDIHQEVGPVLADPGRVHQLLMNLCTNAVHAMTGRGRLGVVLEPLELKHAMTGQLGEIRPGQYARLSVSDNGCGMDATTQARIFEPFFTTKGDEGTGLGLAVVWNVVETHGGNLQVESTPGRGTTFRIYLPLITKTPVEELAHGTSDLPHGTERLLVVDDEPVLRTLYEDLLTDLGYEVRCCSNGIEAMTLLTREPGRIDLVITDQTMPGMTGCELTKAALALRPDLPIVLCSGYSNEIPDDAAARALGIRHYCTKPVNLDQLARIIRRILDQRR